MKNKVIKFLGFILSLVLIFSFSACANGKSAYEIAVDNGFEGSEQEWLDSLKGADGKSAYQIATDSGLFEGSEQEWIESLKGTDGVDGKDVFEVWYDALKQEGYQGNYSDFLLEYIKGNIMQTQDTSVNVTNNTLLSSVVVYAKSSKDGAEKFFTGGGTIIKDDKQNGCAYIVTNYHVVYDSASQNTLSQECYVMFYGMSFINGSEDSSQEELLENNAIKVKAIGGSFSNDIAVLKLENSDFYKNSPYLPAKIANSDNVIVGDSAITVGNPESEGLSVTKGIVSVDSEYLELLGADDTTMVELRLMRTDSDINHGNSGGGLFNSKGELEGVVSVRNFATDVEGFGYAIPSNVAIGVANNIISRYEDTQTTYDDEVYKSGFGYNKCTLGIEVYVSQSYASFDVVEGVVRTMNRIKVSTVHEGSAQAYIHAGDELKSATLGGITREINRLFSIPDLLLNAKKGDILYLDIVRNVAGTPTQMSLEIPLINSTYVQ